MNYLLVWSRITMGENGDKTNQNVNVRRNDLSTNLIDVTMTLQW